MRKKGFKFALLVGIVLFLMACSGSVSAELYFSDIFEIAYDQDLVYYTKGTVEIESFSDELDEELNENIKKWFSDAKNFRIIERDYDHFVVADIMVPVINYENWDFDIGNDMLILVVELDDDSFYLSFELSDSVTEMIDDYLYENYFSSLEITNWDFTIDLKNDTREEYFLELFGGVYANDEPIPYGETYIIDSREAVMIRFSDVIKDYAHLYGEALFGVIY